MRRSLADSKVVITVDAVDNRFLCRSSLVGVTTQGYMTPDKINIPILQIPYLDTYDSYASSCYHPNPYSVSIALQTPPIDHSATNRVYCVHYLILQPVNMKMKMVAH